MDRGAHLADFGGIDIDHDLFRAASHAVMGVGGHGHIQTRANDNEQVGVL